MFQMKPPLQCSCADNSSWLTFNLFVLRPSLTAALFFEASKAKTLNVSLTCTKPFSAYLVTHLLCKSEPRSETHWALWLSPTNICMIVKCLQDQYMDTRQDAHCLDRLRGLFPQLKRLEKVRIQELFFRASTGCHLLKCGVGSRSHLI